MGKTKMFEVNFPGWQLWIFSFTVNFLVLAVQPLATLAQTETDSSIATEVANKAETADLEPKILSEINRVRTTPQDYALWLESQRQYYDGIWLKLPGEKPVRTNRGRKALEEAIAVLKEQQPLAPLESSDRAAAAATSELKNFANSNNIQYFSYGRKTAAGIVMDLVVDELFPDRRRRQSLLSSEAEDTGVACKPDPRYAKVCAIAYSDSDNLNSPDLGNTVDVAISEPEVESEAEITTPEATEELPAQSPTNDSPPEPEVESEAEITTPEATEELPAQSPTNNSPSEPEVESEATSEETTDLAALPVPPQPQAPPSSNVGDDEPSNESEKANLEEELQIAQAESEIEQKQQELAKDSESTAEAAAEPEVELDDSEQESDIEVDDSEVEESEEFEEAAEEFEEEEQESEVELDGEEAESESSSVETEAAEVAINTETADFSETIEEGILEQGDRVIADDGSLYDFYPLQGRAGDSFTIYLESDDFDAFVALVDSNGKTVGENDDISQSDSNSQIEVTLPADGVYNVIVNTYDEKGTGKYTLKVTP